MSATPIFLSYVAGLLAALSPCILPALPLVLSGVASRNPFAPLVMALGLALGFAAVGTAFALAGTFFGLDPRTLRIIGALIIGLAGIALLFPPLADRLAQLLSPAANLAQRGAVRFTGESLLGAGALGLLLGLVWSPCAGPILGAAIGLAAQAGNEIETAARMLIFGAGAATPLLIIAYGARSFFERIKTTALINGVKVKKILGGVFVALAALILSGADTLLEEVFLKLAPERFLAIITAY